MAKKRKICRWCEHFVPRASMCVHDKGPDQGKVK